MLCLTRSRNERLILRDGETGRELGQICVVEIRGNKVRLGFEGPQSTVVIRSEIDRDFRNQKG